MQVVLNCAVVPARNVVLRCEAVSNACVGALHWYDPLRTGKTDNNCQLPPSLRHVASIGAKESFESVYSKMLAVHPRGELQ